MTINVLVAIVGVRMYRLCISTIFQPVFRELASERASARNLSLTQLAEPLARRAARLLPTRSLLVACVCGGWFESTRCQTFYDHPPARTHRPVGNQTGHTDGQTHTHTHTQAGRQARTHARRQAGRQAGRKTDTLTHTTHTPHAHARTHADRQTDRPTDRQTDRQTDRPPDRQPARKTDRLTD